MKNNKVAISIEFDNDRAARGFAEWLCGVGEQDYWNYQEYREEDEDGDITATEFHYHGPKDRGKFMCDNTIRTTCSRLDKR